MAHQTQNIENHHQGDALDITVTVEKSDGTAKNITGATPVEYLIKSDESDADVDALLTKTLAGGDITLTDAGNGVLEISIATGDTSSIGPGNLHHRLRLTDSSGDRVTVFTGSIEVVY